MRELTNRMQRNESTQRFFQVHNKSDTPLLVEGAEWQYGNEATSKNAFRLADDVILPVEVLPGQHHEMSLSFMPDTLHITQATMRLQLGGSRIGQWLVLPVVGNLQHGGERVRLTLR